MLRGISGRQQLPPMYLKDNEKLLAGEEGSAVQQHVVKR
jgi:hypothetical protein